MTISQTPADLQKALQAKPAANTLWNNLTPISRRDFISWIQSAKQEETRARRIVKACSMLSSGKRRPCCYSRVPLSLYKALSADSKAKAGWSKLTPDEKRDMVDWVEDQSEVASIKQKAIIDKEKMEKKIEKVCAALTRGKKSIV